MPIKVPNDLPAVEKLQQENVFVMTDSRAMTQDIRPLEILILNLMPTKIDTETQLTRLLGNTPLQVELELLQTSTHKAKNVSEEHMLSFYKTFDQVKANYYDGMIITGAPVELMDFEEVEYWDELCEIMEWTKTHVHSTFHICWGAQAALYYHYGIQKHILPKKLSGVYEHRLDYSKGMLFRGFDDVFYVPHSRNTTVYREDIEKIPELKIIASSDEAGVFAVKSENDRQIFIMGHSEYDGDTLKKEYERDKKAGLHPDVPDNYFPDDDDTKPPIVRWRSCANLLYSNWLNYFVYQSTPYDIRRINEEDLAKPLVEKTDVNGVKVAKFGGTSLADADAFRRVADILKSDKSRKYTVVSAPGYISEYDIKVTDYLVRAADAFEAGDREKSEKYIDKAESRFEAIADDLKSSIDETGQWDEFKTNFFSGAGREYLISRGEYSCAKLLAEYAGFDFIDAAEIIKFSTNGKFDVKSTKAAVEKVLAGRERAVIPGFYGSDASGSVVTFPRGGSDITGAVIAAAIGADMYENWTDVRGLLLADPKVIKSPLTVPVITYRELREMAVKGTEVVHEDAVIPVERVGIPMNIRCTAEPEHSGTLIVKNADYYESMLDISGISGKSDCAEITIEQEKLDEIPGFRKNLRNHLAERGIKVITELSGVDSINLVASRDEIGDAEELEADLKNATGAANVRIDTDMAVISVIGRKLDESPSISVRALEALAGNGIELKLIDEAAGRISMTIGVRKDSYVAGVKAIYEAFTRKGPED